ncbi:multidrug resistance protein MdtK [Xenorhabdus vietnamensis]|uniref:Multidrug resistance protein MdtK n=1 Tax=Xenorhabdus vietnamensis TaxID=351656 RepID=A0A1Y2SC05_9GAMM|nr:multidrug resistance protein MdtK [Xenorhabdus vietnamensis]
MIMSGHYSTNDLTAVSLGSSVWFPIFVLGHGVIMMLSADVAKHRSHNDTEGIKESINNYISASLILSIPTERMGLIGFWYGLVLGLLVNAITLSMILRAKFKKLAK